MITQVQIDAMEKVFLSIGKHYSQEYIRVFLQELSANLMLSPVQSIQLNDFSSISIKQSRKIEWKQRISLIYRTKRGNKQK